MNSTVYCAYVLLTIYHSLIHLCTVPFMVCAVGKLLCLFTLLVTMQLLRWKV